MPLSGRLCGALRLASLHNATAQFFGDSTSHAVISPANTALIYVLDFSIGAPAQTMAAAILGEDSAEDAAHRRDTITILRFSACRQVMLIRALPSTNLTGFDAPALSATRYRCRYWRRHHTRRHGSDDYVIGPIGPRIQDFGYSMAFIRRHDDADAGARL